MGIAFDDRGAGPPVLLLHGQPGDRHDWDGVAHRLEGCRVIAPDRPGYGDSLRPAIGLWENAAALRRLVQDLEVTPLTVAGHSYGAAVALALAEAWPEAVSALVLVSPAGGRTSLGPVDRAMALPGVGEAVGFAALRTGATLAHWAGRLVPGGRLGGIGPRTHRRSSGRIGPFPDSWRHDDAWRSFAAEQRSLLAEIPAVAADLGRVRAPATIVAGRRDRVVPPGAVEELTSALPQAKVIWVEGVGHLLPWRRPDVVAEAVLAATRSAGGGGPSSPAAG